jgi:hypothetical protein
MTPTPKLRFVGRDSYSHNGEHFQTPHKVRILQQWWKVENVTDAVHNNILDGEWRDVPLEVEV